MRTGPQLGRGNKSAPILGKSPDGVHPYFRFTVQNLVLRVSNRKNFFPMRSFLLEFLTKCLSECPNFTIPPLPWAVYRNMKRYSFIGPKMPWKIIFWHLDTGSILGIRKTFNRRIVPFQFTSCVWWCWVVFVFCFCFLVWKTFVKLSNILLSTPVCKGLLKSVWKVFFTRISLLLDWIWLAVCLNSYLLCVNRRFATNNKKFTI